MVVFGPRLVTSVLELLLSKLALPAAELGARNRGMLADVSGLRVGETHISTHAQPAQHHVPYILKCSCLRWEVDEVHDHRKTENMLSHWGQL